MTRKFGLLLAVLTILVSASTSASAKRRPAPTGTPFGIACSKQQGVLFCQGNIASRVPSFDGVPIDLNVTLPVKGKLPLPLVILSHGYGGSKFGLDMTGPLAKFGYAVLAISARGFGDSCGSLASRSATPGPCSQGYVRLDDARYELRDLQYLSGLLVDQGFVNPSRIGFTGESYGGGVSMEAAVLKDRVMATDGTLIPWTSPKGVPMRTAAAVPVVGWSDLAYALMPNGRTLDYTIAGDTDDFSPTGVMKFSFVKYLYQLGLASGFYAAPGANPEADLTAWYNTINAGEPYDGNSAVESIQTELTTHHSPYYFDDSEAPAPMLIANGWTDDLFPADEAIRLYNRTLAMYPKTPIALMFMDFGHPRGQNKTTDLNRLLSNLVSWFNFYMKGQKGSPPLRGVEVLTQTCPFGVPSGGPLFAPNWAALHPGEVRFQPGDSQSFSSAGGEKSIASAIDPIQQLTQSNSPFSCTQTAAADEMNAANWRLPRAAGKGYTLAGAPTVIFNLSFTGNFPEIAARLWDIAPTETQTLIARGLYRPTSEGMQVLQLHPAAWHFASGHIAKFEMLGQDSPYARASNGSFSITISDLDLRLPVHEKPDCKVVTPPAAPVVPSGAELAPGVNAAGGKSCRKR